MTNDTDKDLVRKRGIIKGKLTFFGTYLNNIKQTEKLTSLEGQIELNLRLEKIETLFNEFDTLQMELEEISDTPEVHLKEREMFEGQYFSLVAAGRALLEKHRGLDQAEVGSNASFKNNCVRLPKIDLPHFNGNYQHWLEFRDTFNSLIHNNDTIDLINKFHYLRASLKDSAALIIKSLDFKADNYTAAWDLLCLRFDNKRLLVNHHVQALFNVKTITKESCKSLRYIIDITNKNLRALATLNQPVEHWDTLVIHMMSTKLDPLTAREWEERRNSTDDPPNLENFIKFLTNRADVLEAMEESSSHTRACVSNFQPRPKSLLASVAKESENRGCPLCHKAHYLYACDAFRALPVANRVQRANQLKVCLNCLRPGHTEQKCKHGCCKYCRLKHNTLLHQDNPEGPALHEAIALSTNVQNSSNQVLLSTALAKVSDNNGKSHVARVLLDNGSTSNFVTREFCGKLNLTTFSTQMRVSGINSQSSQSTLSCSLSLESIDGSYKTNIDCIVLPKISSSIPSTIIDTNTINIPPGISLADPTYYTPSSTDILLGAEIFWDVIGTNRIDLGRYKPTLCDSKFGWLISGSLRSNKIHKVMSYLCQDITLASEINRFWELDSIPEPHKLTQNENACEQHFINTTYRKPDGRFVVSLPLKDSPSILGDSYSLAKRRFLSIERRLEGNQNLKKMYVQFINEYISLGHMSLSKYICNSPQNVCYLPHHSVLKESSTTTKLRVVFDASAKYPSGKSLNDIQRVGSLVQDDLLGILLRFRQYKFVVSADIEKMYRQIEVSESQRCLQNILWRQDSTQPLRSYTLNTLTYGTASAPFLATRCLHQLGLEAQDINVKRAICHDFYVDDLLTGADSVDEAIKLCQGITEVLSSAKFSLRKWHSNNHEIMQHVCGDTHDTYHPVNLSEDEKSKTLGLLWRCSLDTLSFSINIESNSKVTKRTILSIIAQVFDPLGIVSPCIIQAKIIMQRLWKQQCSWDEEVPQTIKNSWILFTTTLESLNHFNIPRCIVDNFNPINFQIHTFSDASEQAYGACIYLRCVSDNGTVSVRLIGSKSKVAPIKPTTIPRLELCAALIGSRLCAKVTSSIILNVDRCYFWSDSMITLGWIASQPSQCKQFIRHRVCEIQESCSSHEWRYVPTNENPADLVSRGLSADLLRDCDLWWSGPQFLKLDKSQWPASPNQLSQSDLPETVNCYLVETTVNDDNIFISLINKYSNLSTLQRLVAYILRFINACRKDKKVGPLSSAELNNSLMFLIRLSQSQSFPKEYQLLTAGKELPAKNRILSLSPFMDHSNQVIRVGGRLANSNYEYNVKHPILLCGKHTLTRLIFEKLHKLHLHPGPRLLLAIVRQTYWPLKGIYVAKRTTKFCIKCCRFKGQTIQPVMGNLPNERTHLEFPFLNTGVDYAGPVMVSDRKGRGAKLIKSYICLFICFATKAVHLELVSDLSKEAFIASLNRFISRRGKPQTIFSDNGTTFVGTFNELSKILSTSVSTELIDQGINFTFIPAYAPHFGGLWESAVKSTKHHLRRLLHSTNLTFEEMTTLLCQIEAVLNSRPLIPLSDNPADLYPLTPAHFLIGRSLVSVPQSDTQATNITSLKRFQRVQHLKAQFWKRFSLEYISILQTKAKWRSSHGQLKEGDLVILKDKALPPLMWLLGRVQQVLPGGDGVARVADIRTRKGVVRRAYNTICPLPQST